MGMIMSKYPFGDRCYDSDGYEWVRIGHTDRWTQPGVPANVPCPTTEQLADFGPFTSERESTP